MRNNVQGKITLKLEIVCEYCGIKSDLMNPNKYPILHDKQGRMSDALIIIDKWINGISL